MTSASASVSSGSETGAPIRESATETQAGPPQCSDSPESMADCAEQSRYEDDLRFVAQARSPNSDHWQAVQDLCFDRFTELGYETTRAAYPTGVNVIGRRQGRTLPLEHVVVAAHYDHIAGCDGADDNATGVAGTLEVARVLAEADYDRSLVVACWDQEEAGLIGSRVFVMDAMANDDDIIANFNFEMIGFTSDAPGSQSVPLGFDAVFPEAYGKVEAGGFVGNFITIVADDLSRNAALALIRHADRLDLPSVALELDAVLKTNPLLRDLRRSDHATFWDADFPALMITDSANLRYDNYHCASGPDSVELLDHEFAGKVVAATVGAAVETLGLL